MVSNAWKSSTPLPKDIEKFATSADHWSKTHFGNIFWKKRKLIAKLNGIQRSLALFPSSFLIDLEKKLQMELDLVLTQEEELWALKYRINWMIFGDQNTSFYHLSTIVRRRRRRNKILAIKNSVGNWLTNEREVMKYITKSFIELYTTSHNQSNWIPAPPSKWQSALTEEEHGSLGKEMTDEEIKAALWSLKATKAPRPNGLHAGFFQWFWLLVGGSVKDEIKRIFGEKRIPDYLNKTLIALIPKILGLETIGSYRPIILCNTIYKMVTKVMVARLRPFLSKLVSPLQTAFVLGRRGTNNAIIVQELIHTISQKKRKGWVHGDKN